jgi:hypothetical protein
MKDGRTIHLRGSWHGGTPPGWNEMTIVDMSSEYTKNDRRSGKHKWEFVPGRFIHKNLKPKAWFKCMGSAGLYVTDELLIKSIAKYQAHVRVALVKQYKGHDADRVQPFLDEWGVPKFVMQELKRQAWLEAYKK